MKRIINYRPIFFLFIVCLLCIYLSFKATLSIYFLFAVFGVSLTFFIFLILKKKFIFLCFSIVAVIFVSSYTFFYIKNYQDTTFDNQEVIITGRLDDFNQPSDNFYYFRLSNLKIIDSQNKTHYPSGNLSVSVNDFLGNIDFDIGYKVVLSTKIMGVSALDINSEINNFYIKNNIRYTSQATVQLYSMILLEQSKTFIEEFKSNNQKILIENFGETKGNLAFAVLYGNKDFVDEDLNNSFKVSGVAHIFAVSGLHVMFIIGILLFFLKKFKLKPIIKFSIIILFLVLLCILCDFSPSVLRASLMAFCLFLGKMLGKKNDALNSISLAGMILIVFSPMLLFDAGFQMSFACVFGIIFFNRIFNKIKIKNSFLKSAFLLVSINVFTLLMLFPILSKSFGYFPVYSLVANLITIPIFSVFFCLLFIINFVVLVLPFLGFLFFLPSALLTLIIYINGLIASLPFSYLNVFYFGEVATIFYYIILFFISSFVILKPKIKVCVSTLAILVFSLPLILLNLPNHFDKNEILFVSEKASCAAILYTKNDKCYILNPEVSKAGIKSLRTDLISKKITEISGVFFTTSQKFEAKILSNFLDEFGATVYLPKNHSSYNNLLTMGISAVEVEGLKKIVDDFLIVQYFYFDDGTKESLVSCLVEIMSYKFIVLDCTNILNGEFQFFLKENLDFGADCVKVLNNPDRQAFEEIVYAKKYVYDVMQEFKIKVGS